MVTDPPTHKHTHKQTGPITIHCAAASAQCKYLISKVPVFLSVWSPTSEILNVALLSRCYEQRPLNGERRVDGNFCTTPEGTPVPQH